MNKNTIEFSLDYNLLKIKINNKISGYAYSFLQKKFPENRFFLNKNNDENDESYKDLITTKTNNEKGELILSELALFTSSIKELLYNDVVQNENQLINCTILTKPDYNNGQVHGKCIFNGKIPQIPPKECGIEVGENGIEPIYSMSYNVTRNHLEIVINFIDKNNRYDEVEL